MWGDLAFVLIILIIPQEIFVYNVFKFISTIFKNGSDEVQCLPACIVHVRTGNDISCFKRCIYPMCECLDMYFQCNIGTCISLTNNVLYCNIYIIYMYNSSIANTGGLMVIHTASRIGIMIP